MAKVYHVGIIGFGGFGQFLQSQWEILPRVRVTAISDTHALRAEGETRYYRDWQKLIRDPAIDIVSICTPPSTHAEIAVASLRAGKHVIVEKPLAITLTGAEKIIAARAQSGKVATVDFMLRYHPLIRALAKMTRAGIFGKLQLIDIQNFAQDASLPREHWFWDKAISGGIFVEHGVHFFDLAHLFSGSRIISTSAFRASRAHGQEDVASAMTVYANGVQANHWHAFTRPGIFETTQIRLVYDLAQVDLSGWIPVSGTVRALADRRGKEQIMQLPGFQIQDFRGVDTLEDISRPEGWGGKSKPSGKLHFRGVPYPVQDLVKGTFGLEQSKGDIYGDCVRSVMQDVVHGIEQPGHMLQVNLEDGFRSLKTALEADRSAFDAGITSA